MKTLKKVLSIIIMIIITAASISGCSLIKKTPEAKAKEKMAKIGSKSITRADLEKEVSKMVALYESIYGEGFFSKPEMQDKLKELKLQVLDNLVNTEILLTKAKELKLIPDDKTLNEEIDKEIKESKDNFGGEDKFKSYLDAMKMIEEDYRAEIKDKVIIDKLYNETVKDVAVKDEEVSTYYYSNQYDFTEKPNKMKVSHILVDTEDKAKEIKAEIDKGLKFEDAAKKYGTDGTKDVGGDLGDVYYSNNDNESAYDLEFLAAAIKAEKGKVTDPIKTQFGYHLILVRERETYNLKALDTVKDSIKEQLLESKKSEAFNTAFTEWKTKLNVKVYTDKVE